MRASAPDMSRGPTTMSKRDILWLGCYSGRHEWRHIGGRNACCRDDPANCGCSVPVHECAKCGDCDYGDNAEADQVRAECQRDASGG
jgi:hypothetical protein